ncbi:MAG: hypothetical protein HOB38_05180 [Deltaproteobacteria bacterium]|jgi:hypothetical protein|nr:hypothetical protein [Deltaproteobacteria bacterium]MBT4637925.1 hypothetical protein [Deltaproteobacteria bacterium]MBT6611477.1 hypothetical protein [Deltaproteobacteria bacterium]
MFRLLHAIIVERIRRKKLKKLKVSGVTIEAVVTGHTQEPYDRYGSSNYNDVVIRLNAKTTIHGVLHEFKSERLDKDKIDSYKEGDKIKILIENNNPKNYYFDPEIIY